MSPERHLMNGGARAATPALLTTEPEAGSAPEASMSEEEVRARIQTIFRDDMELEITPDTDVIDGGVLDSMVFVQLLVRLEEEFGVTVDVETLELEEFRNIASIARYVVGSR